MTDTMRKVSRQRLRERPAGDWLSTSVDADISRNSVQIKRYTSTAGTVLFEGRHHKQFYRRAGGGTNGFPSSAPPPTHRRQKERPGQEEGGLEKNRLTFRFFRSCANGGGKREESKVWISVTGSVFRSLFHGISYTYNCPLGLVCHTSVSFTQFFHRHILRRSKKYERLHFVNLAYTLAPQHEVLDSDFVRFKKKKRGTDWHGPHQEMMPDERLK